MTQNKLFNEWWDSETRGEDFRDELKAIARIAWENGAIVEKYKKSRRVSSIADLRQLCEYKASVVCPKICPFKNPRPAAFVINLNGTTLLQLFNSGMFVYEKGGTE